MKTRDELGQEVRRIWVEFANFSQPLKPKHLIPWEHLDESDKDIDRRIGEKLFLLGIEYADELKAEQTLAILKWKQELFESYLDICSPNVLRKILILLESNPENIEFNNIYIIAKIRINSILTAIKQTKTK